MRDPTARSEWRLAHCQDCHADTNHWHVRGTRYRCVQCTVERELPPGEHGRDGLIEKEDEREEGEEDRP